MALLRTAAVWGLGENVQMYDFGEIQKKKNIRQKLVHTALKMAGNHGVTVKLHGYSSKISKAKCIR
jgi:hypothetical protein